MVAFSVPRTKLGSNAGTPRLSAGAGGSTRNSSPNKTARMVEGIRRRTNATIWLPLYGVSASVATRGPCAIPPALGLAGSGLLGVVEEREEQVVQARHAIDRRVGGSDDFVRRLSAVEHGHAQPVDVAAGAPLGHDPEHRDVGEVVARHKHPRGTGGGQQPLEGAALVVLGGREHLEHHLAGPKAQGWG